MTMPARTISLVSPTFPPPTLWEPYTIDFLAPFCICRFLYPIFIFCSCLRVMKRFVVIIHYIGYGCLWFSLGRINRWMVLVRIVYRRIPGFIKLFSNHYVCSVLDVEK